MANICRIFTICTSFVLLLFSANTIYSSPKREFRGAWFPTVTNRYWKDLGTEDIKQDICNILDSMAAVNTNAVIFQVRPQADALFVSNLEPWSRFITGEQGKAPNPFFDPAAFVLEECHKRGMEFHAWFNPYRVTSNEEEILAPEHIYFKKPEIFVKYGKQIYFNPGEPESRAHTLKVIIDFVNRYDIDAIHFDDYFYPYRIWNVEFQDDNTFIKYGKQDGFNPPNNGKRNGINDSIWLSVKSDWRRNNVSRLVKELSKTIKDIKPWVKFGISPFGIWRSNTNDSRGSNHPTKVTSNYDDLFADILLWCNEGWIDYNAPQLYWPIGHKVADYKNLAEWWSKNKGKAQLYVGQSISATLDVVQPDNTTQDQLYQKIKINKELGNYDGNIWWSGVQMVNTPKMMDSLRISYQKHPALHPLYPNIDLESPKQIQKLEVAYIHKDKPTLHENENPHAKKRKYIHILLKWKAPEYDNLMNEAKWYAVYLFKKGEQVDITNASNLLKIINTTYFESSEIERGDAIAITAIDRMWNESIPTIIYTTKNKYKNSNLKTLQKH